MPTKKIPSWAWPAAFVACLAFFLLLSNQTPTLPNGQTAIVTEADYESARIKMEGLALPVLRKFDSEIPLSPDEMKDLREAGNLVDRMNAYQPMISGLSFLSGKIHHALGEDVVAERMFRQCTLDAPNDAAAHPTKAEGIRGDAAEASYQLSLLIMREPKAALEAAEAAVKFAPKSSDYLTARASALNELRRTDEAKKDLEKALLLDPTNHRAAGLLRFITKPGG